MVAAVEWGEYPAAGLKAFVALGFGMLWRLHFMTGVGIPFYLLGGSWVVISGVIRQLWVASKSCPTYNPACNCP